MKKPWSISTTVRNPERLRDFLGVLKQFEGNDFSHPIQVQYQIKLIQEKLYKPNDLEPDQAEFYSNLDPMPYKIAEDIFNRQNYEDPPMRGRQSVNPLNKLGFAIARNNSGPIKITELGNYFLSENYDISKIFFNSLLKLQFPNPWSEDFTASQGFNICPFIATLHLIKRLNEKTEDDLTKEEFSLFVTTLTNYNDIDSQVSLILKYRKTSNKKDFIEKYLLSFYKKKDLKPKDVTNLYDYGDNSIRYFRLTKYFKIALDAFGNAFKIGFEPSRKEEICQILESFDGSAIEFTSPERYISYLIDFNQPNLPWSNISKLKSIAMSLRNSLMIELEEKRQDIKNGIKKLLEEKIECFNLSQLEDYNSKIRKSILDIRNNKKKFILSKNISHLENLIVLLTNKKNLRKIKPEEFEKIICDALQVLNDEILIKPNYIMDDDGLPINHAPANKADIECFYKSYQAVCEVTLNCSKMQWVLEGQPIMRHLRDFEKKNPDKISYCLFIAPKIHQDTYSQFWMSVKYEYDGLKQKIVPISLDIFIEFLQTICELHRQGVNVNHEMVKQFYSLIIKETTVLNSFSSWSVFISKSVKKWKDAI